MTHEERARKIASYGAAPQHLIDALKDLPREMWTFKPSASEWSVHEIIVHIADSEANSFIRCRRLVAEPGSDVLGYDQDRWASELRYHDRDPEESLELFRLLRGASYNLVRTLPETVFGNTIEHSENGTMTMDDWLDVYERHIPGHIAQMRRNLVAWKRSSGQPV